MIDGMMRKDGEAYPSIEEHEPFNALLWERAKEQARQEEDLIEEIASLRRKMPGVAIENHKAAFKGGMERDEKSLAMAFEGVNRRDGEVGIGALERQREVEEAWRRGVGGLEGLKGTLPEYVAKAERAGRAEAYVLSKEKR